MKTLALPLVAALLISCSGKTPEASASMPVVPAASVSTGGMFYDLLQTTKTERSTPVMANIHTRMFLSAEGGARVERDGITVSGHKKPDMLLIGNASRPTESILIDGETKTYTVNHFGPDDLKAFAKISSTVSNAGDETILGFHCVHARIVSRKNFGGTFTSTDTLDLWKSRDVPVPAVFGDWMNTFENKSRGMLYGAEVPEKLKQMGCTGFTVKMEAHVKSAMTSLILVKAEHRDLPASLFSIPAGYTETKEDQ